MHDTKPSLKRNKIVQKIKAGGNGNLVKPDHLHFNELIKNAIDNNTMMGWWWVLGVGPGVVPFVPSKVRARKKNGTKVKSDCGRNNRGLRYSGLRFTRYEDNFDLFWNFVAFLCEPDRGLAETHREP